MTGRIPFHAENEVLEYSKILDDIQEGKKPTLELGEDEEEFLPLVQLFHDCNNFKSNKRPTSINVVKKLLKAQKK